MSLHISLTETQEALMYKMLRKEFDEADPLDTEKTDAIINLAKRCGLYDLEAEFNNDLNA